MALINWPKTPKLSDLVSVIDGLAARVDALEKTTEIQHRDTAARLADLDSRSVEAFRQVAQNTEAIQAILTLLHPDPDHPIVTDDVIPNGEWLHGLVMHWIETYGRLAPGEETS